MKPIDDEISVGRQHVGNRISRVRAECMPAPYVRVVTMTAGNSGIGRAFVEHIPGYGPS